MTWVPATPRDRRAVAAGAAVLALALVVRLGVLPFQERLHAAQERITRDTEHLNRERRLLRDAQRLRGNFDSLGARLHLDAPRLLRGGTHAAAQAALSARLDEAASGAPAQLARVEPLPGRPAGFGLLSVGLQVEGESDFEGLLTLLADIEAGPALLRVSDLDVRAVDQPPAGGPGAPAAATTLMFRFVVRGFVARTGAGGESSSGPAPVAPQRGGAGL